MRLLALGAAREEVQPDFARARKRLGAATWLLSANLEVPFANATLAP